MSAARTLALQALKAMQSEAAARNCGLRVCDEAIIALEAELAQPAEPVAWMMMPNEKAHRDLCSSVGFNKPHEREDWTVVPLYTAPPPAEPVAWCGVSKSTLPIYREEP